MKKQKLDYIGMYDMGIIWCDIQRVKRNINNKVYYGDRYLLSNKLTKEQTQIVEQFKNVIMGTATYRYAQEIQHTTITLYDKKIR